MAACAGVSPHPFSLTACFAAAASRIVAAAALFAATAASVAAYAAAEDDLLDALQAAADEEARIEILVSLAEYGSETVRLALEAIAGDGTEPASVRMQAICSLAGSATADSVPLLVRIAETDLDERHGYWACAIPLLGQIADRRAMPLLHRIARLDQEDLAGMDHMAIAAIAGMADARDLPFLIGVAYVVPVRAAVMEALARIASPDACEILIGGLQDGEEPEVVAAAERGLTAIGEPAIPFLEAALDQPTDSVFKERVATLLAAIR